MKVGLSVEALSPELTGIGRYTWELVKRLHDQNIESVQYYYNRRWVSNPAGLLHSKSSKILGWKRKILPNPPKWYQEWSMKRTCNSLLFHGPNYFVPECADLAIATVHDLSVFKFPDTHPAPRIRQFEDRFTKSMSRVTHLITDSQSTRKEVIDFLGLQEKMVTAVPLGVSHKFRPMSLTELSETLQRYGLAPGRYSLCVSTLEPRKKIDKLLTSFQLLPAEIRYRYPLVLVGGYGWLSESLQSQIASFTGQGWLRYLGFISEKDLPFLYAGARTFFYPSMYEGFGLPVLEAMASGVPVVTSNTSSLPEVSSGASLLVNSDDVEALSLAIYRSLEDTAWRLIAVDRGLAAAASFTWKRCVEETVLVYELVSGEKAL